MYFDPRDVASESNKWYESISEAKETITVKIFDPEDCDFEEATEDIVEKYGKEVVDLIDETGCATFPMKYVVCGLCNGTGKHVNPSIDAHGITAEEWDRDWDYDDREMYMSGGYDVQCYECHGKRVVPEIDNSPHLLSDPAKKLLEYIDEQIEEEAAYVRTCMTERAMGA
jgi:hypothetical protein